MQTEFKTLSNYVKKRVPSILSSRTNSEITFYISSQDLIKFVTFMKRHTTTKVEQLIDITAVDFPQRKMRFEVLYQFLSVIYNTRFTVSISIKEGIRVDSLTSLYSSAGWYERETWDRFGIYFVIIPTYVEGWLIMDLKDILFVKTSLLLDLLKHVIMILINELFMKK